jgi:organic hydroperoxide reductase OsmC/OhrA
MDTEYKYEVQAQWTRERSGFVSSPSIESIIDFAAPPEFKGESGKWTPEHFLVAGVVSCFLITFRAIAEMSKVEVLELEVGAEGVLRPQQQGWRFCQIDLTAFLRIAREQDRELAMKALKKAEQSCLVAHALNFPITMEPYIEVDVPALTA